MKRLLFLTILSFITLPGFSQDDVVQKGQQAPDFSFVIQNGSTEKLSDYRGKVVLINFFATWCGPCMSEMPLLQKNIWLKYKDNDRFRVMSIGREHSKEEVTAFKKEKKFDFPIYPDKDKSIYTKFATKYIPRNYIVDKKGVIVYTSMGFSEDEFNKMTELIADLLK